jgi:uncharacterized membrane protein
MHPTSTAGFTISPVVLGAIYIALGVPLALRRVRPNGFYGFRTSKTMDTETIWYEVNAFTGKAFIWCGSVTVSLALLVALLARVFPVGPSVLAPLAVAIDLIPLAVAVVASSVVCYRA